MSKKRLFLFLCAGVVLSPLTPVKAQNASILVDATSGYWDAVHHTPDGGVTTDVCVASSLDSAIIFRADRDMLELRTSNSSWNLVAKKTTGEMILQTGDYSHTFKLVALTEQTLGTVLSPDETKEVLEALSKGSLATLKYGAKTTRRVSLIGAGRVLNAFRACAVHINPADLGVPSDSRSPF